MSKYEATGKKMDIGAGCVRFRKLENLPLDLVAEVMQKMHVDAFIAAYESLLASAKSRKS